MASTEKFGHSETGGVIRFHEKSGPLPIPRICPSTSRFQFQREELKNQIYSRHLEYIEIEKESKLLSQKVEELDALVKHHDYEVACLKYSMEKTTMDNAKLEASLKDNQENNRTVSQLEVTCIPPKTEYRIGQGEKTSNLTNQRNLKHKADLQKDPQIFCVCGVQFTTKQNLREHIKYYTLGMNFSCPTCGIRKYGLNQLRAHMKATHSVSSSHLASLKGCRLCGQLFKSLAQLHEHRQSEQKVKV